MIDQEYLDTEIFPKLDRADVFKDLDPKDKGSYYLCLCPVCGNRSAYIYKDKFKLHCNRGNHCEYKVTIMEYLNNGEKATGQAFWNVVDKLGELTNTKIPKPEYSAAQTQTYQASKQKSEELEEALGLARAALPKGAIDYLFDRGIPAKALANLDIGYVADAKMVLALELVKPKDSFLSKGEELLIQSWTNRLIFAIRDHKGKLKGFVGRAFDANEEHKYLNSQGLDVRSIGAIGLDVALKGREDSLILVEGIIDVYILRALGIDNVSAIGGAGSAMDSERLKLLSKLGVKRLTLMLDNDKAGRRGISHITRTCTGREHPNVYAIDPSVYRETVGATGDTKDPGEMVAWGITKDRMIEFVETHRHSGYKFLARSIKGEFASTESGIDDYIRECITFDSTVKSRDKCLQLEKNFWPEVCRLAGVDLGFVLDIRDEIRQEILAEEKKKNAAAALKVSLDALQAGDLQNALHSLQEAYEAASPNIEEKQPVLRVIDRLPQHSERLAQMSGQKFIGLQQKVLGELDKATLGFRQMITICAEPGIGKTILMAQLFEDILLNNQDTCGVFVSWELTGDEILDRMKSRDTMTKWQTLRLESTAELRAKADRKLAKIADRMVILEHSNCSEKEMNAQRIIQEVDQLKRETGCERCVVCIDYLQIFPVPDSVRAGSDLARDDYIIKEIKKVRYHLGDDPVFAISETNKTDGTMGGRNLGKAKGSGRTVYASDAVFFLNRISDSDLVKHVVLHNGRVTKRSRYGSNEEIPSGKKEIEEAAEQIRESLIEEGKDFLELSISKIRDGGKRRRIFLTNHYEYSTIIEGIDA